MFTGVVPEVPTASVDAVPVAGFGLKLAVAPVGSPLALRLTLPVKPPVRVMLIVYVVLAPAEMDREVGEAESEKSAAGAGAVTTSVTDVAWLRLPLTPVIVTLYVPVGVLVEVVTDIVEVEVVGFGLNVAAAPAGSPLALSVTLPVNPPDCVIVMV